MKNAVYGLAIATMLASTLSGCNGASPVTPSPLDTSTPMPVGADEGGTAEPQDHRGFVHKIVLVFENSNGDIRPVPGVQVVLRYDCAESCSRFVNGLVDDTTDERHGKATLSVPRVVSDGRPATITLSKAGYASSVFDVLLTRKRETYEITITSAP